MNSTTSSGHVILIVLLALLLGGLLLGQEEPAETSAANESPAAAESAPANETPAEAALAEKEAPAAEVKASPSDVPVVDNEVPDTRKDIVKATDQSPERTVRKSHLLYLLHIFVLAVFVGFFVIAKVPPTLHTPLMSGSNAISGITLVGAVAVSASLSFSGFIGFLGVLLATINVVGGYLVTHRMLAMFKRK